MADDTNIKANGAGQAGLSLHTVSDATLGTPQSVSRGPNKQGMSAFGLRMYYFLERAGLSRLMGQSFGGKRDYYESFGWDKSITLQMMWDMYNRGGIARRIARAFPEATWSRAPQIYARDSSDWNLEVDRLIRRLDLWNVFQSADILAALGRYAIVVIGTNRGALEQPIPTGGAAPLRITYLQPYGEDCVQIAKWDDNPQSPRFGQPEKYRIGPSFKQSNVGGPNTVVGNTPTQTQFEVHHSRVLHITRDSLGDGVYGTPILVPVWNYLLDLQKVLGASSESYWRAAYQGLHANLDPELDLDPDDEANLTAEMDEYQHDLRRIIRTRGVEVKSLGSTVADPKSSFDVLVTAISGSTTIPKRILLGSESGSLASTQDRANWAERIEENRSLHAEPQFIWQFVRWCVAHKVLPELPSEMQVEDIKLLWPDAYRMSPLERGQTAAQTARSLANIAKGLQPIETKPATLPQIGADGQVVSEGTPAEYGDPLITHAEARRIIGLSTDQQVLIERPED